MALVGNIAIFVFSLAFLAGLLITAVSGSAKAVKITLTGLTVLFIGVSVAGFAFSSGWLIFLYTQLIVLVLILYFVIVAGAVVGGGIYVLRHRQAPGEDMGAADLADYLPVAEFAAREGITEDRALSRIRSGYYRGGNFQGKWYVHNSELSAALEPGA